MKKLTLAILAIIYLATSTGMTVQMHNCMGKVAGWDLGHDAPKKCGKCGMEEKDGRKNNCCNSELKFIKNNSDQKATESVFQQVQLVVVDLPVSFIDFSSNNFSSVLQKNFVSNSPPRSHDVAVYIFKRTFLI